MISVLINAYAIAPNWGSEQGVGWNWTINIARFCKVYVITEGEWKDEIEVALAVLPQRENITMYYLPVSDRVRRMCWNQGDYRFYFFYALWQHRALKLARRIVSEQKIDVIHQLNMVGFREPGLLWKIKNVPFVWGPICGFARMNLQYFKEGGKIFYIKMVLKNLINQIQFNFSHKINSAFKKAGAIIASTNECAEILKSSGRYATVIPETGIISVSVQQEKQISDDFFHLLWVGKFDFRKRLDIAIKSLALLQNKDKVKLHIVGAGDEKVVAKYQKLAFDYGVKKMCVWHGKIANADVMKMMGKCNLFYFTSIDEATSTVVMEAIQNRLPVLCHDCCGFGSIVDETIGIKIPVSTPDNSAVLFAAEIDRLYESQEAVHIDDMDFINKSKLLTYDYKARQVVKMYESLILK